MVHLSSSYALGIALWSAAFIILGLISFKLRVNPLVLKLCLGFSAGIIFHYSIILLAGRPDNSEIPKFLGSFFLLIALLVATGFGAKFTNKVSAARMHLILRQTFLVLLSVPFLSILMPSSAFHSLELTSYSVLPFSEPAQFSLAIAPFAIYSFATNDKRNMLLFGALSLLMVFVVKSLIFLLVIILCLTLFKARSFLIWSQLVFVAILGISFLAVLQNMENSIWASYYIDRISLANQENLSVLVYLQGLEIIQRSIIFSNPFGLGFQQLGYVNLDLETSMAMFSLYGINLNLFDGGFLAAKLFGEFGIFAVPIMLFLLFLLVRSYRQLVKIKRRQKISPPHLVFANCCIFSFAIDLFFRSHGYFSIGVALLFYAIILLQGDKKGL